MKICKMIIGMTALVAMMVSPAMAHREWGYLSGPGHIDGIVEVKDLDLTTEQAVKINALRKAHLEEIKILLVEMTEKSRTLRDLWFAPQSDQKRIEVLQAEARKIRLRLTDRVETYRREVYRELTPDQRQRVQIRDIGQGRGRMGAFGMDVRSRGDSQREKSRTQDRWMGIKVP